MSVTCKLTVDYDGVVYDIDVREASKINVSDINHDITNISGEIAFYATIHAQVKADANKAEWLVKKTKSEVGLEVRKTCGKITATNIEDIVETNERVIQAQEKMFALQKNEHILYSFLQSLLAKKDMLITYSANARKEIDRT